MPGTRYRYKARITRFKIHFHFLPQYAELDIWRVCEAKNLRGKLKKMEVVSYAGNSWRRRRPRKERTDSLLYEGDRQARGFAITKESAERDTAACTRRGISYKLGETLPSF